MYRLAAPTPFCCKQIYESEIFLSLRAFEFCRAACSPPSEIILSTYTCAPKEPLSLCVWPGLTPLSLEYQFVGCATVEPLHFNPG
jgi:hypothetical protein